MVEIKLVAGHYVSPVCSDHYGTIKCDIAIIAPGDRYELAGRWADELTALIREKAKDLIEGKQ